jgi:hypothetical protein
MSTILPAPDILELVLLRSPPTSVVAVVRPQADISGCPLCGTRSSRVHSWYQRTLLDLPWHGVTMRLELPVRRFFCDTSTCARAIFTERLPEVVARLGPIAPGVSIPGSPWWASLLGERREHDSCGSSEQRVVPIRCYGISERSRVRHRIRVLPLASTNLDSDGTRDLGPSSST